MHLICNLHPSLNFQHNFTYTQLFSAVTGLFSIVACPVLQPIKTKAQSSQKEASDRRFSYYSFITDFYSLFLKANLKYISSKLDFEFQWPRNNCCLFPFSFSGVSKIFGICLKPGSPLGLCKE